MFKRLLSLKLYHLRRHTEHEQPASSNSNNDTRGYRIKIAINR